MLSVHGFWLPGTTEPSPWEGMAERLSARGLDTVMGGTELMFSFARHDPHIVYHAPLHHDHRNEIIANCISLNCWSAVSWKVERAPMHKGDGPWVAYAGVWNEKLGVGVLVQPHQSEKPHLWISTNPDTFRSSFDLAIY